MNESQGRAGKIVRDLIIYLLITVFSAGVILPLMLNSSWPESHDGLRYMYMLEQFCDALGNGILYPRWLPDTYGGFGYPSFVFYQPGVFYLAALFRWLTADTLWAGYLTLTALLSAGGTGMYLLAKKIRGEETGLFCAFLFLLTPYIYVNMFIRGDMSEGGAMLLTPWPFYFLLKLKEAAEKKQQTVLYAGLFALSTAAIIYCHPAVPLFLFPALGITALYLAYGNDRRLVLLFLGGTAGAFLLGIIISSPYWLTAMMMKKYVNYQAVVSGYFSPEMHFVSVPELFSRFWGHGGSHIGEGMSFQLGLPHFLLAVSGALLCWKNKLVRISFIIYILLICCMLPVSAILWEKIPLLDFVQFPWRILAALAVLQCISATGIAVQMEKIKRNYLKAAIYIAILCVCGAWYGEEFRILMLKGNAAEKIKEHKEKRLNEFYVYASGNEFMPKTAQRQVDLPLGGQPRLQVSARDCNVAPAEGNSAFHIKYILKAKSPTAVLINQLYFPGWQIRINGEDAVSPAYNWKLLPDGRPCFTLPADKEYFISAEYEGPPGWRSRNFVIGLAVIAYIMIFYVEHKRKGFYGKDLPDNTVL